MESNVTRRVVTESAPLPSNKRAVEVMPMKYRDVRTGVESMRRAFETDPLMSYFVSADTTSFRKLRDGISSGVAWAGAVYQNRAVAVDGGIALMRYSYPGNRSDAWCVKLVEGVLALFCTSELKQRKAEFAQKTLAMAQDAFGDRLENMYEIVFLASDPAAQGKGYGSALLRHVMSKSDTDGRDIWLVTTDAWPFYEALGYTKVRSDVVGEGNLAWDGSPIGIHIMHRASKRSS